MKVWIGLILACALPGLALADAVVMKNGDRLTGETLGMAKGTLKFRAAHGAELLLPWGEVASLETDGPVQVVLDGEGAPQARRMDATVDPRRVAYINPAPHEIGLGTSYEGRATLSAAFATGNTESDRVYGDADLTARALRYRYQLQGKIDRRDDGAEGDATAWRIGGNYDRFLEEPRFVYLRSSLERDSAKDLARRASAGAGYGTELVRSPQTNVTLRGGLDYVWERRYAEPDDRYAALGWGLKASHKPATWRLELFHEQDGFASLEGAGVVVRSKTGVRVPFTSSLGITAQLNVDWESQPAPGRESTDSTLLLGLNYAW